MKKVASFNPVAHSSAKILILGSMPGVRSLDARQYYAHPQNSFWKIMSLVTGLEPNGPYEERLLSLQESGIALWDVLHSCARKGSLDSAIEADSIRVNDFRSFFREYPNITTVCFNGQAAALCYKRYVLPGLDRSSLSYVRLPSTSPANASMSFEKKLAAWREALAHNR